MRIVVPAVVARLLASFAAQAILSMRLLNPCGDEVVHLPAGYTYLKNGRIMLNPEHPPLVKELAAAPLLFLEPEYDERDPGLDPDRPDQLGFGFHFLFSNDADKLIFWGRLPIVGLALILGFYIYRWAADLSGRAGGLLALSLFAFSPNLIAHSHLVTMDLALSLFFVVALYHLRRFVLDGGWNQLLGTGVGLGLALGAKFSGVILLPAFGLLRVLACIRSPRGETPSRAGVATPLAADGLRTRALLCAVALALVLLVAAFLVYTIYLFPSDPLFYWNGIRMVNLNHVPGYQEYLLGDFSADGWWYYFLVAFLVKTPVPTLLLLGLSIVLFKKIRAADWIEEAFLIIPPVLFLVVTSALADNLGVRYILPVYPLVFVFCSRLSRFLVPLTRPAATVLVLLGAWYLVGALRIYPDHLAYFNEIVGGPKRGHRILDDSNIDWGQDLKRLKSYMDRKGIEKVKLLYLWSVPPAYYGIEYDRVKVKEWEYAPSAGWYAMSTHMLIRGELVAKEQGLRNNWLSIYEPVDRVGYSIYIFRFE